MYRDKSSIAGLHACFYFMTYAIPITCQFLLAMRIYFSHVLTFACISSIQGDTCLVENIIFRHSCKRMTKAHVFIANQLFMCKVTYIFTVVIIIWLSILLLQAEGIHPNPCPLSTSSDSSISDTSSTNFSVLKFSALSNHLSFVHYNMQCLVLKIDISVTEPFEFDILAFSETLLNPSVLSQDVHIQTFREPECKNRVGDSHGGVVLYV